MRTKNNIEYKDTGDTRYREQGTGYKVLDTGFIFFQINFLLV